MKDDIATKYSAYFRSILYHNNGYFLQVKQGIWIGSNMLGISFCSVSSSTFVFDVFNIYLTDYFLGGRFMR